jgi:hypothetical protein
MPRLLAWLETVVVKAFPVAVLRNRPVPHHYRHIGGAVQRHIPQIRGSRDLSCSGTVAAVPEFFHQLTNGRSPIMTAKRKWSAEVTEHSDALDLEEHIFESRDPKKIAASLKRSAEHSDRRKAEPFQSAMSMLNFYINRAGKNLPAKQKKVLEDAKDELRAAFGRPRED